ncbi:MAG: hypothetical protein PHX08_08745 [Lachnospiraceae bacterium]|nr:hypothetical protein [Lachnospiraceae bacterium]
MKLEMTCRTCEFGSNGGCMDGVEESEKVKQNNNECKEWGASLQYFSEITEKAPWYIKEPYKNYKISCDKFLNYIRKDGEGIGIDVNIYDAIEKIYGLRSWELAGVLDVSMGVLGYARMQKTIPKRKKQFASRLHIPEEFFDEFLSTQLGELEKCKEEFQEFYGRKTIESFKKKGVEAMDLKIEQSIAISKIENERFRQENSFKYQYQENNKMFHDMSDDYKSRDYVIAITLKEGDYFGNIFYEYSAGEYGLSKNIMEDILQFVDSLNCEEIDEWNEEGLLNNNIGLRSDTNGEEIHFELKNGSGQILQKTIPENELQKYIIGYEMIRCDGHGMKKERRRCISCKNFHQIEGTAKGNCSVRGDIVQRSRVICAHDFVVKKEV